MANELGGSEGGFEESVKCGAKAEVKVRSPEEIEDDIQSTSTVTWDPFAILPKELYVKIFNFVDNPTDKQNFMNSHVKFYDLFKADRVTFLFGKVFGELTLLEKKTDKDLIRLGQVCREWDQGIQDYYQLHPDHFAFDDDEWATDSNHLKKKYAEGYICDNYWMDWDNPEEYMTSNPPSKNPFFSRKINIKLEWIGDEARRELLSKFTSFLDTYGQYIWHFSFQHESGLTPQIYSSLVKWLGLMPELKTLRLIFEWAGNENGNSISFKRFAKSLQIEPPKMKKLQNFHVLNFPAFTFNRLLEGMEALEKVEIVYNDKQMKGYKLPKNLTEAALTLTGLEDFDSPDVLKQSPLLRKLIINTKIYASYKQIKWPERKTVWNIIEEKFPALEDLHLSLIKFDRKDYKLVAMEQSLKCRLNLPNLKRLSIILPNLSSLDFLQEMKELRELKIQLEHLQETFKGSGKLVRQETIQFNRDLGSMSESNIWTVFPKLRKLSIQARKERVIEVYSYERRGVDKMYKKEVRDIPQSQASLDYRYGYNWYGYYRND